MAIGLLTGLHGRQRLEELKSHRLAMFYVAFNRYMDSAFNYKPIKEDPLIELIKRSKKMIQSGLPKLRG